MKLWMSWLFLLAFTTLARADLEPFPPLESEGLGTLPLVGGAVLVVVSGAVYFLRRKDASPGDDARSE